MLLSPFGIPPAHWSRRAALAAALALAAPAIGSATARAAGSVRVAPVGATGAQTVNLAQLRPDVHDASYTAVATPGGKPKTVKVTSAYSLPLILQALNMPPSSFGSVEIAAPAGPPVVLSSTQATSASAYHDGPPLVWEDGSGAHFLLPSSPSGNANAGETFTGPGGAITIGLHRSAPLYLGISGSPLRAVVGGPVGFTSKVFGAGAAPLHYQWTFGDGTGSSQAAPTHAYTATGSYGVYLEVTESQDAVGASPVIQVVVGNAPRPTGPLGAASGRTGSGTTAGSGTTGGNGTTGSAGKRRSSAGKGAGTRKTPVPKPRAPRPPRPVGPLVSGIAISYVRPAAPSTPAGAGGRHGALSPQLTPDAGGPGEGLWIALAALLVLLGGAFLEWNGAPRARLAMPRSR